MPTEHAASTWHGVSQPHANETPPWSTNFFSSEDVQQAFNDTIRNNITLGARNVAEVVTDAEEIEEADTSTSVSIQRRGGSRGG